LIAYLEQRVGFEFWCESASFDVVYGYMEEDLALKFNYPRLRKGDFPYLKLYFRGEFLEEMEFFGRHLDEWDSDECLIELLRGVLSL